jgi:arylsulfatase A-like enzyme
MNRRNFLRQTAAALLPEALAARPAPARKPNILFVLADQWRPQTLVSSGDPDLKAPNLHKLARDGVHFSRVYASDPVCSPSRASVLTGRYAHACRMPHNNLLLPLEERCIAEELKFAGYATGYIGKWHLDGEAKPGFVPPGQRRRGFGYWAAFNRGHLYYNSTYYRDTDEPIRPGGFEPDYQTSLAAGFIKQNKDNPFYLYLSWGPPHPPRKPPPEYARLYDPRRFHLRANVPESYVEQARESHAGYYGLCTALDDNFGRLLRALDECRIADDTIVIFTADHGDMLGSHGLEGKGVPYEESARIPLLLRYPRMLKGGQVNDMLVSNVDFMPTLLSFAGVPIPPGVQGVDLSQQIVHGKGLRRESVYCQGRLGRPGEWRMVVRGLDKLVVDQDLAVTHLYNLGQDPYEMENLVSDPSQRTKRDELKAILTDWMRRTGDRMDPSGLKLRG